MRELQAAGLSFVVSQGVRCRVCGAVVHCAAPKDAAIPVVRTRIGLMQLLVACAAVLTAGTFLKVVVALLWCVWCGDSTELWSPWLF